MNTTDFNIRNSTVISSEIKNDATEIWVRYDDGREACYTAPEPRFQAREGQTMTAILYGGQAVAIRNDATGMKIPILMGEDLLGSGPEVVSRPLKFWIAWFVFIAFVGPYVSWIGQSIFDGIFEQHLLLKWLGDLVATSMYVLTVVGVPYFCLIHPRIRQFKHQRRIAAMNKIIKELYLQL